MKKIFLLSLALITAIGISACQKKDATPENVAGNYENASLFMGTSYQLNENGSYNKPASIKGTYEIDSEGVLTLTNKKDSFKEYFVKKGDYYYSRANFFDADTAYGLAPTFDKNGRSDQSFAGDYVINQGTESKKDVFLTLSPDGTYDLFTKRNAMTVDQRFNGSYRFEKNILWLEYEGNEHPMILANNKLYFDVIKKIEG